MTLRLDAAAPDFEQQFVSLLSMKRESSQDVDDTVRGIIEDVIARGDEALIDLSKKFDRIDLAQTGIAVSAAEVAAAEAKCSKEQLAALDHGYEFFYCWVGLRHRMSTPAVDPRAEDVHQLRDHLKLALVRASQHDGLEVGVHRLECDRRVSP